MYLIDKNNKIIENFLLYTSNTSVLEFKAILKLGAIQTRNLIRSVRKLIKKPFSFYK